MATNTINENVEQAILDFGTIKQAIVNKGVSVPSGTPTSQYGNKISSIQTGADVSGVTATAEDVDTGKVFVNSSGTEVTGNSTYKADYTALNTLVLGTTATQADVDSGKLFVKADGTQGTGSSTYKADYTALNTLVGQTTATDSDVASGKLYVKSDGTQGTGTASGGGDDLKKLIDRSITTIIIPDGTTKIGDSIFYKCYDLVSVTIPNSITSIGVSSFAFDGNINFGDLILPQNLTLIDSYAFRGCGGLTSVTFMSTPTTIKIDSFYNCTSITTIRVPWSSGAVANAPWGATNATLIYNYTP